MPPKPSEKGTRVSSSEEENLCHVDASDAILKDIQNKLEKLNESTDRIEERLVRIENDTTSIKGKVADLEKGLNSLNTEVAEMKQDIKKKADFEKLQMLGQDRKVFIAYPATLKYLDENGNPKVVSDEDLFTGSTVLRKERTLFGLL